MEIIKRHSKVKKEYNLITDNKEYIELEKIEKILKSTLRKGKPVYGKALKFVSKKESVVELSNALPGFCAPYQFTIL